MKVYGVQFDIAWEDPGKNFVRVRELLEGAGLEAGSLVVLPEMFATGFSMNAPTMAVDKPSEAFLVEMAQRHQVAVLGGYAAMGPDGRGQNLAMLATPHGPMAPPYQKMHPFSFGKEGQSFSAGPRTRQYEWAGTRLTPLICYDLRFPEVFRSATLGGGELFCVIANWPAARESHWMTLLQARAIENQAFVIGVNRVGADPYLTYGGRSLVVDPKGHILADGGSTETILSAEINFPDLRQYRREFPALNDIRREYVRWES